ncbi:MAG: class III signal peptide-containing protein [Candidatus Diapherotrites archaeon]
MKKLLAEKKAQTSIEMLLILGAAVVVATTVGLLFKQLTQENISPAVHGAINGALQ